MAKSSKKYSCSSDKCVDSMSAIPREGLLRDVAVMRDTVGFGKLENAFVALDESYQIFCADKTLLRWLCVGNFRRFGIWQMSVALSQMLLMMRRTVKLAI